MNRTTHITTFYSFKGGVGRTMLLANVGVKLAMQGKKVLLWDLDVEAPGMHFIPGLRPNQIQEKGFLEWLLAWQEKMAKTSQKELKDLFKLVRPIGEMQGLNILPAFGDKADSTDLYQRINWHDFLVNFPDKGLNLFRQILDFLSKEGRYDHILIDSRTGVTDLGGIMVAVLPDATVLVGNYAAQNLKGLLRIYHALQRAVEGRLQARIDPVHLERLLVISPVPDDQEELRSLRQDIWKKEFPMGKSETMVEIPFDSRLLFKEELVVVHAPKSSLSKAYEKVVQKVTGLRESFIASQKSAMTADEAYPDLLKSTSSAINQTVQGKDFEKRVSKLLTLLGYTVEPEQRVDNTSRVDLIARKEGLRDECFMVECKDQKRPISTNVLEKLMVWLGGDQARNMRAEGMVVGNGFTLDARNFAKSQPNIHLFTIEELEKRLFDFGPYLANLRRAFEESELARTYVHQRVFLEDKSEDKKEQDLLTYAKQWAKGEVGNRLWLLLGDYGTGKTSFFKRFAYELAKTIEKDPTLPVPLAIDLKKFPNAISMEGLLQEHLRLDVHWHGNPEILLYMLASGRIILLLDAFDEMGMAAAGRSIEDQFRQLARPAANINRKQGNRILITCRTHFFRDQQKVKDLTHGVDDDLISRDSAMGRLARSFDASIDELLLFNTEEIDIFLSNHLAPDQVQKAKNFIRTTYDLPSLAPRPVILEMIVQSLPDLLKSQEGHLASARLTSAGLYHAYTSQWLDVNAGGSLQTSPRQRKKLLERLSFQLWGREQNRIHHKELIRVLEKLPSHELDNIDSDRVDLELRTAAFLIRSRDGFYWFSHKSFLEFFYARLLFRALIKERQKLTAALDTAPVTLECVEFLSDLMLTENQISVFKSTMQALLAGPYQRNVSENALRLIFAWAKVIDEKKLNDKSGFPPELGKAIHTKPKSNHLHADIVLAKVFKWILDSETRQELSDRFLVRTVEIVEKGDLSANERVRMGDLLSLLGDPRFFGKNKWYLPDDGQLGFVQVEEGEFLMGTKEEDIPGLKEKFGDSDWYKTETPQRKVSLFTYYIAKYPVTVAQFKYFCKDNGYNPKNKDSLQGIGNHPVRRVYWDEACMYCEWLTEKLRKADDLGDFGSQFDRRNEWVVRLPTEAEWEKAARGDDGRIFPWGDQFDVNKVNCGDTGINTTSVVGCFPQGKSPFGCLDMAGNVYEWCLNQWHDNYENYQDKIDKIDASRVVRGGCFWDGARSMRCASRYGLYPGNWDYDIGFRIVVAPDFSDL